MDYSVESIEIISDNAVPKIQSIQLKQNLKKGAAAYTVTANQNTDSGSSWRLVYDGEETMQAVALFLSEGYTTTVYDLYCDESKQACLDWAAANGIEVPDAVLNSGPSAQLPADGAVTQIASSSTAVVKPADHPAKAK